MTDCSTCAWNRIEIAKLKRELELVKDAVLLNQLAIEDVQDLYEGLKVRT